ncbi:hypothetical protein POTOM_058234 [Populus tomentosa]|uniref:Uncharacterized protein n=1 Tax=Populus tomentosa TaxID=118781 RepID=A0A8X7XUV3_POPTO|nr:hypothetical protein POTOM_058234 [Populus tomentosa]
MIQKLGIEETEASQMNGVLYKSYGTSMAALKAIGYDFDIDDYHKHQICSWEIAIQEAKAWPCSKKSFA